MARAEIECGVCGFRAVVAASSGADGRVNVQVECECPAVRRLVDQLRQVDPLEFGTFLSSSVYRAAETCLRHPDCLIPVAILRAANVEAGLALPSDASVRVLRG
ncbi:MAG: hypothetical protein AB1505_11080 [Candidatus Latescibacterota bacterium]